MVIDFDKLNITEIRGTLPLGLGYWKLKKNYDDIGLDYLSHVDISISIILNKDKNLPPRVRNSYIKIFGQYLTNRSEDSCDALSFGGASSAGVEVDTTPETKCNKFLYEVNIDGHHCREYRSSVSKTTWQSAIGFAKFDLAEAIDILLKVVNKNEECEIDRGTLKINL